MSLARIQSGWKKGSWSVVALAIALMVGLLPTTSFAQDCPILSCPGQVTVGPDDLCECIGEVIDFSGDGCQLRLLEGASCFIALSDITGDRFTILGQTGIPFVDIDASTIHTGKFVLKNVNTLILDSDIWGGVSSAGNRTGHQVRIFGTMVND